MTTELERPVALTLVGQDARTGVSNPSLPGKAKRPAIERSEAASCRCGARWTGTSKCHCSADGCHRLFSSVAMFDRHRVNGRCVDPETIMVTPKDKAKPPFIAMKLKSGVWCSSNEFTKVGELFGTADA